MARWVAGLLAWCAALGGKAQIDAVTLTELGRYQHPYVVFPDSFSAPVLSSRIDRLGRPYVYLACRDSGLFVWDITVPTQPVVVRRMHPSAFGGLKVMNLEQVDTLLYLALGELDNAPAALAVLNVADPADPQVLDQYTHTAFSSGSAVVKVQGTYAYLGCMKDGLLVVDVSDPQALGYHGEYLPDTTWPGIANYPPNARGMALHDTLLYLAFDAGAVRVISIADPAAPVELAHYMNPQHPPLTNIAYNNLLLLGDRLYATYDYCGLEVIDVSDPLAPAQVAWLNPWNCFGLSWFGSDGHANELVTTRNDSLLVVSGADSEVLVYDITDRDDPQLKGGHILPNDSAATWGVDARGDLVIGNYINNHGLLGQPFVSKFGGAVLFALTVDLAAAVAEGSVAAAYTLAPSPTTGPLWVRWSGDAPDPEAVVLQDLRGRVLQVPVSRSDRSWQLDLATHPPGLYLLTLVTPTSRWTRRVVVAR